jgi:hypothetical protein
MRSGSGKQGAVPDGAHRAFDWNREDPLPAPRSREK